ncbi:MAG: DNA modification methylase [Candidatus Limnocylindrales bacterium]
MAHTAIKPHSTNPALDDPGTGSLSPVAGSSATAGARSKTADGPWRNRIVAFADAVPLDRLVAHPENWRLHSLAQHAALSGVLGDVGLVASVVVSQRTQHVLDGHLRVELARQRKEPTIPVTYVDVEEDEERTILATFDPLGALATADKEKLDALLRELSPTDSALGTLIEQLARANNIDVRSTGLTDPDALPDVPEAADVYVQPGDLYQLGPHRLLCGDATKPADVARLLDGAEPTLLCADTPYGVSLDPTWRDRAGYDGLGAAERPYMRIDGQSAPVDATEAPRGAHVRTEGHRNTTLSGDTRIDWSEAFALVPSLRVGYVWHAGVHAGEVAEGLERIGFEIISQVIWDKGMFALSRGLYHWAHEPCFVVRAVGAKVGFYGERNQSTVWRVPSPKMIMAGSKEEKWDHPAQKPVVLSEIPITNHLRPGEAVYDPFVGSGTTIIAAERLGRVCYAMEIEPRFSQIAIERWESFSGKKAAKANG